MVVGKEGNTLFSDLLKTLYQSLSFIKGYLPSKVVYQADDLGSWPKTKFLVPRSLKKIPQSGICSAVCGLSMYSRLCMKMSSFLFVRPWAMPHILYLSCGIPFPV